MYLYQISFIIILCVFYCIYFAKMIIQKKKGITANQIFEEEKYLAKVFGNEYSKYKKSTGRYFIFF